MFSQAAAKFSKRKVLAGTIRGFYIAVALNSACGYVVAVLEESHQPYERPPLPLSRPCLVEVSYQADTYGMLVPVVAPVTFYSTVRTGLLATPTVANFDKSVGPATAVSEDPVVDNKVIPQPVPTSGFVRLILVCGTAIGRC